MKITIEFDTKEELIEPQLASALGEMLMNHSAEPTQFTRTLKEFTDLKAASESDETAEDPVDDTTDQKDPPKESSKKVDTKAVKTEINFTLEDLRRLAPQVAEELGGTKEVCDLIEELTGSRVIDKKDKEHYDGIGMAFTELLTGGSK